MIEIYGPRPDQITHQNILDFAKVRKLYFVDKLGWDLTHTSQFEWDEYDLPHAQFVVAYENGVCVGGARLMRTDSVIPRRDAPPLTYMLSDFATGRIQTDMTSDDLASPLPSGRNIWEMTRFFASKPEFTGRILEHVNEYLIDVGADSVLTISPRLMPIVLRRLGYRTRKLSRPMNFDGKIYVALSTSLQKSISKAA